MDIMEDNKFEMKIRQRDKNVQKLLRKNHGLEQKLGPRVYSIPSTTKIKIVDMLRS